MARGLIYSELVPNGLKPVSNGVEIGETRGEDNKWTAEEDGEREAEKAKWQMGCETMANGGGLRRGERQRPEMCVKRARDVVRMGLI